MSRSKTTNLKRTIESHHLYANITRTGRIPACEVCRTTDPLTLEIHHVQPTSCRGGNAPENLVFLCHDHHALIERFYWWERSKLMPEVCREIKAIALAFAGRRVPFDQVHRQQRRTTELWNALNNHRSCQNFLWWKVVYTKACKWAGTQNVLWSVDPKDAITSRPWFRVHKEVA